MRYYRPRHFKMLNLQLCILLLFMSQFTESCLPSWFRQERSAPEPFKAPENSSAASSRSSLDTNEIGDAPPSKHSDSENVVTSFKVEEEEVVKELTEKENEYEMEYEEEKEEEEEALKYNEEATGDATSTLKPSVRKEIEKLKEAKCKGYCHHNATCHVEVIFRDTQVAAVVPSCHCPHGWEGTRCDRHYVQAFYAPINGRYNGKVKKPKVFIVQPPYSNETLSTTSSSRDSEISAIFSGIYDKIVQSSSAVPVLAFMMVMLVMFIAIVVYAYRRMSKRSDDLTYTMSNMCPPEAFTVLKTPNGRHIPAHQMISCPASNTSNPCTPHQSSAPGSRIPLRQLAVRYPGTQNNFFSILRSQGTIPSRSINDDDTPKHYKSVPRVEVSAINNSGHIDFSTISFQTEESDVSKASRTCPPPSHTVIDIDSNSKDQDFRSPSRSSGEPGSPTTCEPMISSMNL